MVDSGKAYIFERLVLESIDEFVLCLVNAGLAIFDPFKNVP